MKPKQLVMPQLDDAKELRPAELNNIRFSTKHTVLTPELLEKMSAQTTKDAPTPQSASKSAPAKKSTTAKASARKKANVEVTTSKTS